jgi:hypothetical protein
MTKKQSAPERTILAMDLGHKTGWCLGRKDYGTYVSPGETIGDELNSFRDFFFDSGSLIWPFIYELSISKITMEDIAGVVEYIRRGAYPPEAPSMVSNPHVVVYERPHLRGWAASFSLVGRAAIVEASCSKLGVQAISVHSATIKKYITGSGRATKEDVIKAVKKRGFKPKDDNAADAIALWLYAQENL